ncbi:hypothetical protein [Streptomyces sp. NPDC057426]|uniref:hypothetical protein n=1 Tax=Streptomyces sp. NPDC057426 TaxID=3346128 RepID=UPI00369B27D5
MTAIPLALDGYLDDLPVPGDDGTIARFRVISSPTDDVADETVFACSTVEPFIAYALLTEIQPGDLVRISGYLTFPDRLDQGGPRLAVDSLELLAPAPARYLVEMVLDRYGPYIVVLDPEADAVPVFTEAGTWVGHAPNPDAITDLIAAYEAGGPSTDGN